MAHLEPRVILTVRSCSCIASDDPAYRASCTLCVDQRVRDDLQTIAVELVAERKLRRPLNRAALIGVPNTVGVWHRCGCVVLEKRDDGGERVPTAQFKLCQRHGAFQPHRAERITLFARHCGACCVMLCAAGSTAWDPHLVLCPAHSVSESETTALWELNLRADICRSE
jgi:hypothetical protein